MSGGFLALVLAAVMSASRGAEPADAVVIGDFSAGPGVWRLQRLDPNVTPTQFSLGVVDGVAAVLSQSDAGMAMFARALDADVAATPILCWRWRIENTIAKADIRSRAGDDLAARVYIGLNRPPATLSVAERVGLAVARLRYGDALPDSAINYVWDNRTPPGTLLANAYTERTQMFVLRSGDEEARRWVEERRNILEDMERAFGARDGAVVMVALATDTDNTGARAAAAFADLHLVAPGAPCRFPVP